MISAAPRSAVNSNHAARAFLETVLGASFLLIALWALAPQLSDYALVQGAFFVNLLGSWWCAVRLGSLSGPRRERWLIVGGVTIGLGLVLGALTLGLALAFGEGARWLRVNQDTAWAILYLVLAAPAFLAWRGILRFWHYWNRLRRRRMAWAITHTNLVVVAVFIALAVAVFIVRQGTFRPELARGPVAFAVTVLTNVVLPVVSLTALATVLALALLLPPAALLSYQLARRTTRRLQTLVTATSAARGGTVPPQVVVSGEDEVAELQADFNTMAADLERALSDLKAERDTVASLLEARRKLIASVSHELRTPVATLRGYLDLLLSAGEQVTGTAGQDIVAMERELTRLETLIDDLFTLARADAAGLALQCSPADVGLLVQQAVDIAAPLAWRSARVKVMANIAPALPEAVIDPSRFAQVMVNLLRNAVSHTPPGGIVIVEVMARATDLELHVTDTGEGIAPEDLPHIWERFYRGAGAREGEGTGLGLAVVKGLVEGMGGRVAVESELGKGSRFTVSFPAVRGQN